MIYTFADCQLNTERFILCRRGHSSRLRRKVFQVLMYFIEHGERVVSKQELCDAIWPEQYISEAALESTVAAVRRAVGDSGSSQHIIQTLVGHGYRFVASIQAEPGKAEAEAAHDPIFESEPEDSELPQPAIEPQAIEDVQATILVVDDEVMVIKRLEALLIPRGYQVVSAANGAEALDTVEQERPDLVLLDVMMPKIDGFEVCRQLKDRPATRLIPVVLMTALGDVEDRIRGLDAGADDFLTKPVHRDELLARIRTSLRFKQTIDHTVEVRHVRDMRTPIYLTLTRQDNRLVVDLAVPDPVMPRTHVDFPEDLSTEIGEELTRIATVPQTRRPAVEDTADAVYADLQRLGRVISAHLLPEAVWRRLADADATDLFLRLDESVVHLPWELAFDGQEFWFNKFNIGRQVIGVDVSPALPTPMLQVPERLKMLMIVDPAESCSSIMAEANQLGELLRDCPNLDLVIKGGQKLRKIDLLLALNEYDIIHYMGEFFWDAEQPSQRGWQLHDAVLTASEFRHAAASALLVFAHSCEPDSRPHASPNRDDAARAFRIGSSFAQTGLPHYIGTFSAIQHGRSAELSASFYRQFLTGESTGGALGAAKRTVCQPPFQRDAFWASFFHYGNPTFRLSH